MSSITQLFESGRVWVAEPHAAMPLSPSPHSERSHKTIELLKAAESFQARQPQQKKICAQFGLDAIDSELQSSGLRSGALHEWFSSNDSVPCSILALLAGSVLRNSISAVFSESVPLTPNYLSAPKFILWIGRDVWPTPYLLEQTMYLSIQDGKTTTSKSLLPHCLFINPESEKLKLWALDLALRSPCVAAVICRLKKLKLSTTARLSLAADKGDSLGLIIRPISEISAASSALSRWRIEPKATDSTHPHFNVELLKHKGFQPRKTSWPVELREGICAYEPNQQTLSLHLSADVGDKSGATALQNSRANVASQQAQQPSLRASML